MKMTSVKQEGCKIFMSDFFWSTLKTSKFDFINLKAKPNFIINHVLIFNIITNINMMIPLFVSNHF